MPQGSGWRRESWLPVLRGTAGDGNVSSVSEAASAQAGFPGGSADAPSMRTAWRRAAHHRRLSHPGLCVHFHVAIVPECPDFLDHVRAPRLDSGPPNPGGLFLTQ